MRTVIMCLTVFLSCSNPNSKASEEAGRPLKFISSCELDLNKDEMDDIALLVEAENGRELIILMRNSEGYNAFVISHVGEYEYLSCYYGDSLEETSAGKGNKETKVYKTPGAYLLLGQPEGASRAFFWNGKGFTQVSTGD